jgi:hypothetical protein
MRLLFIFPLFISNGILSQTFDLNKINQHVGDVLTAHQVSYVQDQAEIKEESKPFLDSFAVFMINNPLILVELNVYNCEPLSSESAYKSLSCRRTETITAYLTAKGVNRNHILEKSHTHWPAVMLNGTDIVPKHLANDEHILKYNQRTEFKLLLTDYDLNKGRFLGQKFELKCDSGQTWGQPIEIIRRTKVEMIRFTVPGPLIPTSLHLSSLVSSPYDCNDLLFIRKPYEIGDKAIIFWIELTNLPDGIHELSVTNAEKRMKFELNLSTN